MAPLSSISVCPRIFQVLNLLQEEAVAVVPRKAKQQLLPLLVVLFLISYGLLTLLVVETGTTS